MKAVVIRRHGGPEEARLEDLAEPHAGPGEAVLDGRDAAYVCDHFACRTPLTDPEALREGLQG